MTHIILEIDVENKLALVSLSNNRTQRLIKDLSNEIEFQVVDQIKTASFGLFAIQIDESTDIFCYLFVVFSRFL